MQHEITITVYNPTTDPDNWAADVYRKSFDPSKQDGEAGSQSDVRDERIHCGKGNMSKHGALHEATNFIQESLQISWTNLMHKPVR